PGMRFGANRALDVAGVGRRFLRSPGPMAPGATRASHVAMIACPRIPGAARAPRPAMTTRP
ncbi:MAG: hypothetical protein AAGI01_04770, partial [Myxococcota bacterium]